MCRNIIVVFITHILLNIFVSNVISVLSSPFVVPYASYLLYAMYTFDSLLYHLVHAISAINISDPSYLKLSTLSNVY